MYQTILKICVYIFNFTLNACPNHATTERKVKLVLNKLLLFSA